MAGIKVASIFAALGLKPDKKAWTEGNKLIQGMKVAVAGFLGLRGVQAIGGMIKSVADNAAGARETAQSLGLTTKAVQELAYAASIDGKGGMDTLEQGLKFLVKQGGVKDVDKALMKLADRFAKMPDGPKKTALAIKLFGRQGADLIPLLNNGSKGLAQLRKEARDAGVVVSDETASAFDQFGDDTVRLKSTLEGLKIQVVTALLPTLQGLLSSLREWVKENRALIASALTAVVKTLIFAFRALAVVVAAAGKLIRWFSKGSDAAIAILAALAAMVTFFAVRAAAAWAATLGPIALIVAGLAAVIFVVIKVIRSWDQIIAKVKAVARAVKDAFVGMGRTIRDAFVAVFDWIADKVKWVVDKVEAALDLIKGAAQRVKDAFVGDSQKGVVQSAASQIRGTLGNDEARQNIINRIQSIPFLPDEVKANLTQRVQQYAPAAAAPRAPSAATPGTASISIDVGGINVAATPGMDEKKLAVEIRTQIEDNLRTAFRTIGAERGVVG